MTRLCPALLVLMTTMTYLSPIQAVKDYSIALKDSILFLDAQRSGKLPDNNPIPWRHDSALNDCVPGGWYDAGDHVKMGLPMSSSATLLLWSLVSFKDGYVKAGQLDMMYDMIKWPLDYFLRAWDANRREFTYQVGDGDLDHSYWGRPENMTMNRPCRDINSTNSKTGSDVMGGTVAALSLGAIAFKDKGDVAYSTQLLSAAQSLYTFANNTRGIYDGPGYTSSGYRDELCEASMWLYRATKDVKYLNDAKTFVDVKVSGALSWDDKQPACQELLYEETHEDQYKDAIVGFFLGWFPGGDVTYTPCGLAWRNKWGSLRYAANSAFLALIAAEAGINAASYRKWAVEQINYILGDNKQDGGCYSFEIGYGTKYPTHPHHRGASCPDIPAPCGWEHFNTTDPSPHVLVGALVGGPDENDNYVDDRADYVLNEVATDYNSGFQGALAGILHLDAKGSLPVTSNKCPCQE